MNLPKVEVYNHQQEVDLSEELVEQMERLATSALPSVLENTVHGGGVLASLDLVEVSIINDAMISQVHVDFMGIPGATDVITFSHGEIVVSAETAQSYGKEYGNSYDRELMLYIIHGLLHLAGHEDEITEERLAMEKVQFEILDLVWK